MEIIKIRKNKKINKILDEQISLIVDYLKRGKIIVYPTDTIYGLGCIATDKKAVNRIYRIKKRDKKKPLLILVSSLAMVKSCCYVNKKQEEYLKKVWMSKPKLKSDFRSRPVSVILKSAGALPKELSGGEDSIAVRLPRNEILVKIIRQVNAPIVSTSLNISGKKNLTNISEVDKYFKQNKPDLIIDSGKLDRKPSKLVDLRDINNKLVIRN